MSEGPSEKQKKGTQTPSGGDGGSFELDLSTPREQGAPPVAGEFKPAAVVGACPACSRAMAGDAVICVNCGYDRRKGYRPEVGVGATPTTRGTLTCGQCGYSMQGLRDKRCPECGSIARAKNWRDYSREESKRVTQWAYLTPAIMLGVGTLVSVLVLWGTGRTDMIPILAAQWGLSAVLGTAAFFVLCVMWLGFDAPMHLTALRLVAIDAVFAAAFLTLGAMIGAVPLAGWIFGLIYIVVVAKMLDIEYVEAFVLGVLKAILAIVSVVIIRSIM